MVLMSSFSNDGHYYAQVGNDGKLRIWDVLSTSTQLLKEYTPDVHLASPITVFKWITYNKTCTSNNIKRKRSDAEINNCIVFGTRSGNLVFYNIFTGGIIYTSKEGHHNTIRSISYNCKLPNKLYTSDDQIIVEWNLSSKCEIRKWKCGKVSCIAVSDDGQNLITANKDIKWWNISSSNEQTVVKTFIGHATDVTCLIIASISGVYCVLSASSDDRQIHAWLLNNTDDREAIATFSMQNQLVSLSAKCALSGALNILGCSKTGVLHFYSYALNGNCKKPNKAKLTVQIASEDEGIRVEQIQIIDGLLCDETSAYITYGTDIFLSFEKLSFDTNKEALFIVRQDPRKRLFSNRETAISKVLVTGKNKNVHYVHPDAINGLVNNSIGGKKSQKRTFIEKPVDVPLEVRLENLAVGLADNKSNVAPNSGSLAHLLLQALRSKDSKLLNETLLHNDESIIKTTISKLGVEAIIPFSIELVALLSGRPAECDAAIKWLKHLVTVHAATLISDPDIAEIFAPLFPIVESKLNVLGSLCRLSGRLDLMLEQMDDQSNNTMKMLQNLDTQARLVYQDEDSEESNNSDILENDRSPNDSEDQWDEMSEIDESCEEDAADDGISEEEMQSDVDLT